MRGLPHSILWSWASSVLFQLVLLYFLLSGKKFKRLPFFLVYVLLNLCQVAFLIAVYSAYNFNSTIANTMGWYSEAVTYFAQILATIEILWLTLRPYRGIWGLAWRALATVSAVAIVLVISTTHHTWTAAGLFQFNRGFHVTFATAVIACLLVVRYYSIPVPRAYKLLLAGFCLYSTMDALVNTVLQTIFYRTYIAFQPLCELLTLLSFLLSLAIWIVALRKPLPPDLPAASASADPRYQELSPEINEQLRRLNERLLDLWKMEARPN